MTKNINKINKGDKADGRPLEELNEYEVFENETDYKTPEFKMEASEETVRELGKIVLALSKGR